MSNNLLEYRNIIINESSNSDDYIQIKPYPNLTYSFTNETEEDKYISFSFANENYVDIKKDITLNISGDYSTIDIYYSKDNLNYVKINNYTFNNNVVSLNDDLLNIKCIKFVFTNCTTVTINNIELFEIEKEYDYTTIMKEYKLKEYKNPPTTFANKNIGKIFNEFMGVLID